MPRAKKPPKPQGAVLEPPKKENRTPFTAIEDVINRKGSPLEQKRVAYELINLVGGERGLAKKLMQEYECAAPGSMARQKFFEMAMKLLQMAAPKEMVGDMDNVSEEDIERILREYVKDAGVQAGYPTHVCI